MTRCAPRRIALACLLSLAALPVAGCSDPTTPVAGKLVYWLYPNGSDIDLKLSLVEPPGPF